MTDTSTKDPVEVHVAGKDQPEAARLLLGAAKELDLEVDVVQTIAGGFLVPHEVAVRAGALPGEDETTDTQTLAHPEVTATEPASVGAEQAGPGAAPEPTEGIDPEQAGPGAAPEPTGAVQTSDGVVHEGVVPASAEQPAEGEEVLRGEALEAALKQRNLSTAGSADEKRARVAEYDARQVAGTAQQ